MSWPRFPLCSRDSGLSSSVTIPSSTKGPSTCPRAALSRQRPLSSSLCGRTTCRTLLQQWGRQWALEIQRCSMCIAFISCRRCCCGRHHRWSSVCHWPSAPYFSFRFPWRHAAQPRLDCFKRHGTPALSVNAFRHRQGTRRALHGRVRPKNVGELCTVPGLAPTCRPLASLFWRCFRCAFSCLQPPGQDKLTPPVDFAPIFWHSNEVLSEAGVDPGHVRATSGKMVYRPWYRQLPVPAARGGAFKQMPYDYTPFNIKRGVKESGLPAAAGKPHFFLRAAAKQAEAAGATETDNNSWGGWSTGPAHGPKNGNIPNPSMVLFRANLELRVACNTSSCGQRA